MSVSSVYEQKNLSLISVRITEGMFPMVPWWQGLNNNANCGTSGTKRDLSYEISCSRLSLPELTISCPFSLVSFENSWIGQVRELLFVQVIATVCRRSSIVKCKFRLGRDCRRKQEAFVSIFLQHFLQRILLPIKGSFYIACLNNTHSRFKYSFDERR